MPLLPRVIAWDVDPVSLGCLVEALPDWRVEALADVGAASLSWDWDPGEAELVVVGARAEVSEVLALCRGLRGQARRGRTPLLVLLHTGQEVLARAALEASADACLVLPVHAKQVRAAVSRAQGDSPAGRHTLGLQQRTPPDRWQDEGGEG